MESVFEPAVRKEETPEALVVIVDLPGFRRKDVRVQVDEHGELIISGERSVNEMEEITKEGGRSDTTQSGGRTFRKVVSIPQNVNAENITAKFKNQVLHLSLPVVQNNQKWLTEDVNGGGKPHLPDMSEQSKQDERSNPLKQQGLMQEPPAAAEKHEGAKLPEVIQPDDHKAKANESAEETRAEDNVDGEQPISTHTQAVSPLAARSDGDQSHLIQSKSKKPEKHDKEFLERRIHIPSSGGRRSMFSTGGVLVVITMLVLCAAKYLSYILSSQKAD